MQKIYTSILWLGLLSILGTACNSTHEQSFKIIGDFSNLGSKNITVSETGFQAPIPVDSTNSNDQGHFELKGHYTDPGVYNIKLGNDFLTVIVDQPEVHLKGDVHDLSHVEIIGSPATSSLFQFNQHFNRLYGDLMDLRLEQEQLNKQNAPDEVVKETQIKFANQSKLIIDYIKGYADTTKYLPVAIVAASNLFTSGENDYLDEFSNKLDSRFSNPKGNLVNDFKASVQAIITRANTNSGGPEVGKVAKDFTAVSLDGKKMSLNDFKGRYVLLDFWASWCPPCRAENPNVVKIYNDYKDKGFTVVGFSLDDNPDKWADAVRNDHLAWPQLSDLKGWNSTVAQLYGVDAIPMNFLIGPDGKIIARNLRGATLRTALENNIK